MLVSKRAGTALVFKSLGYDGAGQASFIESTPAAAHPIPGLQSSVPQGLDAATCARFPRIFSMQLLPAP
jgi:hypothetical protein